MNWEAAIVATVFSALIWGTAWLVTTYWLEILIAIPILLAGAAAVYAVGGLWWAFYRSWKENFGDERP